MLRYILTYKVFTDLDLEFQKHAIDNRDGWTVRNEFTPWCWWTLRFYAVKLTSTKMALIKESSEIQCYAPTLNRRSGFELLRFHDVVSRNQCRDIAHESFSLIKKGTFCRLNFKLGLNLTGAMINITQSQCIFYSVDKMSLRMSLKQSIKVKMRLRILSSPTFSVELV